MMNNIFRGANTSATVVCNRVNRKYSANSVASQLSDATVAALHTAVEPQAKKTSKRFSLPTFAQGLVENNAKLLRSVGRDLEAQKEYIRTHVLKSNATALQKRRFLYGNDYGNGGVMSARTFTQLLLVLSKKM